MSLIEIIPLEKDKGNRLTVDPTVVTTIGRTPNIGCLDKKISRNHAEIFVKSDGTLWIKPIHNNPTFFRSKNGQIITLTKDVEFQLNDSDEIGLLPTEYFYRISIETAERENVRSPSPVEQNSTREPEGGIILHTKRSLPVWMANGEVAQSKTPKGRGKSQTPTTTTTTPVKTPSPSKHRTYIGRKKVEGIVYEDEDEDEEENDNDRSVGESKPSKKREKCPYGKFCYRKNPIHRQEAIHPGDPDWTEKENKNDDDDKPVCPYGSECYRKNPDHHKEYFHPKKTERSSTKKRRTSDDEEDDDDGLPNEYDYNDSFIDDVDLDDSDRPDRSASASQPDDPDRDWKPQRSRDDESSTDESEFELLRDEAAEFVQNTPTHHSRQAKKKAKLNLHDPEE